MIIEIGDILVSTEIVTEYFSCDYQKCKGCCCIIGDSGAPLLDSEVKALKNDFNNYSKFMSSQGIESVEEQGFALKDSDGDIVTPLLKSTGQCAYSVTDSDGYTFCAVERGFEQRECRGLASFKKPISCWLFPIRVGVMSNGYISLILSREHLCKEAFEKGKREKIPVYKFLKEPLIYRFGKEFYDELEIVANEFIQNSEELSR